MTAAARVVRYTHKYLHACCGRMVAHSGGKYVLAVDYDALRTCYDGVLEAGNNILAERDALQQRVEALEAALRILADFPIEQHQHRGTPGAPLYGFNNWLLLSGHVYAARVAINVHDWGGTALRSAEVTP